MYLLLALFLIGFELTYEGLKIRKWHGLSGLFESIYRAVIVLLLYFWITGWLQPPESWLLDYPQNFWKIIVAFVLVRFGIFDPLLNLVMDESINYIGFTKWYDIAIRWFCDKSRMPLSFFLFIRLCCFIAGGLVLLHGNTDKI